MRDQNGFAPALRNRHCGCRCSDLQGALKRCACGFIASLTASRFIYETITTAHVSRNNFTRVHAFSNASVMPRYALVALVEEAAPVSVACCPLLAYLLLQQAGLEQDLQ